MAKIEELLRRRHETRRRQVRLARETSGKEPFDLDRLGELFDLSLELHGLPVTPAVVEDLEYRYYVAAGDAVRTLRDFAGYLLFHIENDAG